MTIFTAALRPWSPSTCFCPQLQPKIYEPALRKAFGIIHTHPISATALSLGTLSRLDPPPILGS